MSDNVTLDPIDIPTASVLAWTALPSSMFASATEVYVEHHFPFPLAYGFIKEVDGKVAQAEVRVGSPRQRFAFPTTESVEATKLLLEQGIVTIVNQELERLNAALSHG
jgi:hypothetical protein